MPPLQTLIQEQLLLWPLISYFMCEEMLNIDGVYLEEEKKISLSVFWLYIFLDENLLKYISKIFALSYIMVIKKTSLSYFIKQKHQYLEYFWHQLAPVSPLKTHDFFFVNFCFLSDELSPTGKPNTSIKTLAYQ